MAEDKEFTSYMSNWMRGAAPDEAGFLFHFEHQKGLPENALAIGGDAPDFALADQEGATRTLADLMGDRGVLLVFARSAHWCPYCRNQLAELNVQVDRLRNAGFGIVAITPDPPNWIQDFVKENSIRYPILSDQAGEAIRAYGVLNDKIPPNELQGNGPLPHPGHFLISAEAKVLAREFTGDIRHRPSATTLVAELNDSPGNVVDFASGALTGRAGLSADVVYGGQEIAFTMHIAMEPGYHVYAPGVKQPYVPISLTLEDSGLLAWQEFTFPPSEEMRLEALGETLPVLGETFVVRGRLRLRWSPPRSPYPQLADFVRARAIPRGDYALNGALRFQACSDNECLPPQIARFTLTLTVKPNARAGSPVRYGDFEVPAPSDDDFDAR